jgi:hypothetical protein
MQKNMTKVRGSTTDTNLSVASATGYFETKSKMDASGGAGAD